MQMARTQELDATYSSWGQRILRSQNTSSPCDKFFDQGFRSQLALCARTLSSHLRLGTASNRRPSKEVLALRWY